MFSTIKLYLYAAGAALIAALGVAVKYFSAKAKREEKRRKLAEDAIDYYVEVAKDDIKTEKKFKSRRAEAKAEIKKTGTSSELSDPNVLWLRKGPDKD
jgi:hypothetical protein